MAKSTCLLNPPFTLLDRLHRLQDKTITCHLSQTNSSFGCIPATHPPSLPVMELRSSGASGSSDPLTTRLRLLLPDSAESQHSVSYHGLPHSHFNLLLELRIGPHACLADSSSYLLVWSYWNMKVFSETCHPSLDTLLKSPWVRPPAVRHQDTGLPRAAHLRSTAESALIHSFHLFIH